MQQASPLTITCHFFGINSVPLKVDQPTTNKISFPLPINLDTLHEKIKAFATSITDVDHIVSVIDITYENLIDTLARSAMYKTLIKIVETAPMAHKAHVTDATIHKLNFTKPPTTLCRKKYEKQRLQTIKSLYQCPKNN